MSYFTYVKVLPACEVPFDSFGAIVTSIKSLLRDKKEIFLLNNIHDIILLNNTLYEGRKEMFHLTGRKEMFYLTTHSTHFIYGYMASNIWLRTILIVRKETRCCHIGYFFRLAARVLLYAPSHRQDCTYHGLCYTSHGALAGMRNSSMGPPHEGSIRRPIAPWANALTTELHSFNNALNTFIYGYMDIW